MKTYTIAGRIDTEITPADVRELAMKLKVGDKVKGEFEFPNYGTIEFSGLTVPDIYDGEISINHPDLGLILLIENVDGTLGSGVGLTKLEILERTK